MNVVFVCKYNGERSQIAEAFFRKLKPTYQVSSVGTHASERAGMPLQDSAIRSMNEIGIDLTGHERTQLTPEIVTGADRIVVLTKKSDCPSYVTESPKAEFWDVPEANKRSYGDFYRKRRDHIQELVKNLAREIGD